MSVGLPGIALPFYLTRLEAVSDLEHPFVYGEYLGLGRGEIINHCK